MIMDDDAEAGRCLDDPFGQIPIRPGWFGATGGMIVDEENCRCLQIKAALQDFAGPGLNGRHGPYTHHLVRDQLVARIEEQNPKPLDRVIGHIGPQIIEQKLIAGKYGPLHEWAPQHLCHRTPEAEECLFDLDRAVQQFDPGRRTR